MAIIMTLWIGYGAVLKSITICFYLHLVQFTGETKLAVLKFVSVYCVFTLIVAQYYYWSKFHKNTSRGLEDNIFIYK